MTRSLLEIGPNLGKIVDDIPKLNWFKGNHISKSFRINKLKNIY